MEIMLAGICPCNARGKHEKIYLVVIVLFFISTKVYTLLHNNIFFCRNSPECDLSHVLPDYREQISGTPLKFSHRQATAEEWALLRRGELSPLASTIFFDDDP